MTTSETAVQMIDGGASNPRAIARALSAALDEANEPAARLLWEHLGEILNVGVGYLPGGQLDWVADMAACRAAS